MFLGPQALITFAIAPRVPVTELSLRAGCMSNLGFPVVFKKIVSYLVLLSEYNVTKDYLFDRKFAWMLGQLCQYDQPGLTDKSAPDGSQEIVGHMQASS